MKTKRIKIASENVQMIQTDRFKTITIRIVLREEVKKENITKRNLLSSMLTDSSLNYPTKRDITRKAEDLYSVQVAIHSNRSGKYQNLNVGMTLLQEKYTEKGMLEESIAFLSEVLFHPNIKDGAFDEKSFDYIKQTARKKIEDMKEQTESYSIVRMLECMNENSPLSLRNYGYLEDLESITKESLAEYYYELMKHASYDIYVLGNFDFDEMEKLLRKYFEIETFKKERKSAALEAMKPRKKPNKVVEAMPLNQSKLSVGCTVDELDDFEKNYVWNIYTIMLGASPDSKFFQNIREKHSVAYYVSASMRKLDHIMVLKAGIDKENFEKTVSLMEIEMKDMEKGKFTEEDLEKAKSLYQTAIDEIYDSPNAMIESYVAMDLLNCDTLEERREKVKEVTKEDVRKFAKKVHIDTIYLLEGGSSHEEN